MDAWSGKSASDLLGFKIFFFLSLMIITQEEKIISQKLSIFTSVVSALSKAAMLFKLIFIGGGEAFYKRHMRYLNSELYLFTAHVRTDQHWFMAAFI